MSTAEAEYVAATEACKEVMYLRYLADSLGVAMSSPTILYEDNQACISMIANNVISGRNKHMELKMHYVRERVQAGDIKVQYISTNEQQADILTKNLPRPAFEKLRTTLLDPSMTESKRTE